MDASFALTGLLMGLVGGPHCVAMCGAACGALGRAARPAAAGSGVPRVAVMQGPQTGSPGALPAARPAIRSGQWAFQAGRLISYSVLGAVAAGSMQTVGWLSVQSAALRPVWTLMHVAAALLGLILLWQARQPAWLEDGALRLWHGLQSRLGHLVGPGRLPGTAPLVMGLAWGLLPCGLLYSALLVAALSPGLWQGAWVMLSFALGSALSLLAGPWLWARLRGEGAGTWAVRLAGASLFALSVWALWMGLVHDAAPWCVSPASPLS